MPSIRIGVVQFQVRFGARVSNFYPFFIHSIWKLRGFNLKSVVCTAKSILQKKDDFMQNSRQELLKQSGPRT